MTSLADERCVACRPGAPHVGDADASAFLASLPDWRIVTRDGIRRLERSFSFPDFASALSFTNAVGALADAAGHHPDVSLSWGRVTVSWWTHTISGLHRNDFVMAARTDRAFASTSGSVS